MNDGRELAALGPCQRAGCGHPPDDHLLADPFDEPWPCERHERCGCAAYWDGQDPDNLITQLAWEHGEIDDAAYASLLRSPGSMVNVERIAP